MNQTISAALTRNLKRSFSEVFAYYSSQASTTEQQRACLYKWGRQLGVTPTELRELQDNLDAYAYTHNSTEALAFAYDLVCLIYMDEVIEDIELKMATHFSENVLKLQPYVVNNLLKALLTAQLDGVANEEVRGDIEQHPEVYVA